MWNASSIVTREGLPKLYGAHIIPHPQSLDIETQDICLLYWVLMLAFCLTPRLFYLELKCLSCVIVQSKSLICLSKGTAPGLVVSQRRFWTWTSEQCWHCQGWIDMSPGGTEVICFGLVVRSTPSKVHIFNYSINELIAKWTLMR